MWLMDTEDANSFKGEMQTKEETLWEALDMQRNSARIFSRA